MPQRSPTATTESDRAREAHSVSREHVAPYWMPPSAGPPTGALGATVALELLIGRSAVAAVRIAYAQVHGEGMTLAVEQLLDPSASRWAEDWQSPRPNDSGSFFFGLRC